MNLHRLLAEVRAIPALIRQPVARQYACRTPVSNCIAGGFLHPEGRLESRFFKVGELCGRGWYLPGPCVVPAATPSTSPGPAPAGWGYPEEG